MDLLINIETIHRTYSGESELLISEIGDVEKIKKFLSTHLSDHVEWVRVIIDAIPFMQGPDIFLISPSSRQIANTSYRGKIVKISRIP